MTEKRREGGMRERGREYRSQVRVQERANETANCRDKRTVPTQGKADSRVHTRRTLIFRFSVCVAACPTQETEHSQMPDKNRQLPAVMRRMGTEGRRNFCGRGHIPERWSTEGEGAMCKCGKGHFSARMGLFAFIPVNSGPVHTEC